MTAVGRPPDAADDDTSVDSGFAPAIALPPIPREAAGYRDVSRPLAAGDYSEHPVEPPDGVQAESASGTAARPGQSGRAEQPSDPRVHGAAEPQAPPRPSWSHNGSGGSGLKPIRIGLWGGPGSGKTTFIGALKTAVEQRRRRTDEAWSIVAGDNASLEFMQNSNRSLLLDRRFPSASTLHEKYGFLIRGEIPAPPRKWRLRHAEPELVEFELSVYDRPGGQYDDAYLRAHPELIEDLADCDGLIYLFDPLNVDEKKDSLIYFQATLARLASEINRRGGFVGAKLPHHVAVCVTKFDDKELFQYAQRWGLLGTHPVSNEVCVLDQDAPRFFDRLCDESTGTAEYVRDAIRSNFLPERVRHYVVAAIGYNRDSRSLDYEDTTNAGELVEGGRVIRTNLHPINVVEPIIDLERMIRLGGAR
jgi:hypothetical protein